MEGEAHPLVQNVIVIGDGAVGKTSLVYAYLNDTLVHSYTPTM